LHHKKMKSDTIFPFLGLTPESQVPAYCFSCF
jgi:hypothetical protein